MAISSAVRIPDDMKSAVIEAARSDDRPFSAEIRYLVKLGLERREREKKVLLDSGQARELSEYINGAQA